MTTAGRGAGKARPCLVLYHRSGVTVAPLEPGTHVTVGRTAPSDVIVDDDSLSRLHARFLLVDDAVLVEDLGSTNGTWIGSEPVTASAVPAGQTVLLGDVTAVLQAVGAGTREKVESHDEFLLAVEREHARAQHFRRPFAVLMVTSRDSDDALVHDWLPALRSALRPIDRIALFGAGTLEVLAPELDLRSALAIAERARREAGVELAWGVAAYPETATSVEALLSAGLSELERSRLGRPPSSSDPSRQLDIPRSVIATSEAMKEVIALAQRIADSTLPVLVHGETGAGKEVICRLIHDGSPRSAGPLVAVNCAAIPRHLVESTLFGHAKGAFTGATGEHRGLFEAASGGTLLLDEIGDLPLEVQATLLRVLESGAVMRVGETSERVVDVRVVAATHRDLETMAVREEFRSDLLYRLNGFRLDIPPLRERRDDILPLAEQVLAEILDEGSTRALSEEAREALFHYAWPGNARELKNTIRRAVVISRHGVIGLDDLPARVRQAVAVGPPPPTVEDDASGRPPLLEPGESFRACLERLEAEILREALAATGGNQSEAARRLGMPRRTLVHKIKALGLRDATGVRTGRPKS